MVVGRISAIVEKGGLIDEKLVRRKLSNGLECGVVPRSEFARKFAIIATDFGSNDQSFISPATGERVDLPAGVAHFLEHKMFEKKWGKVFDRFSMLGANANAFTSHTVTAYHFSCTSNFPESLKLLIETVEDLHLTRENVKKEVGIIQQEILMYKDNPNWQLSTGLLEALYQKHPVRIDTAGTVESVGSITKKVLTECFESFYTPANMIIVVAGDLDPEEVFEMCESQVKHRSRYGRPRRMKVREPKSVMAPKVTSFMEIERPKIAIGFKNINPYSGGARLVRNTLETDLLMGIMFGKSNPVYLKMYEKGIIDESFSASYSSNRGFGYSIIGGDTDSPDSFIEECMKAISRVKKRGISKGDFSRTRKRMFGAYLRRFNHLEGSAMRVISGRFLKHNPFEMVEILDSITIDDINRRACEHLREKAMSVSMVLPAEKVK